MAQALDCTFSECFLKVIDNGRYITVEYNCLKTKCSCIEADTCNFLKFFNSLGDDENVRFIIDQ